jgi:hypothetical protein
MFEVVHTRHVEMERTFETQFLLEATMQTEKTIKFIQYKKKV